MARRMASQVSEQPREIMLLSKDSTVLYLHGGPGGQTGKANTVYFNPAVYRVVLFDQRGAGKSTPNADLRENTTEFILNDIELLRKHIGIPKWHSEIGRAHV